MARTAPITPSTFGDCSNGGLSSRFSTVLVLSPEEAEEMPATETPENAVMAVPDAIGDGFHYEPVTGRDPRKVGWMHGGTTIEGMRLHDRQETWAQYDALTR